MLLKEEGGGFFLPGRVSFISFGAKAQPFFDLPRRGSVALNYYASIMCLSVPASAPSLMEKSSTMSVITTALCARAVPATSASGVGILRPVRAPSGHGLNHLEGHETWVQAIRAPLCPTALPTVGRGAGRPCPAVLRTRRKGSGPGVRRPIAPGHATSGQPGPSSVPSRAASSVRDLTPSFR
jgi:hypothetical protein